MAMDNNKVRCSYQFCIHKTKELDISEAAKKGDKFYHKDCLQTQDQIKEIINLFVEYINPNPVFSQLQSVIKNIVFYKGMGSNYLLFGLKYYIKNKIPLNYPQGLYYVVQNKDVRKAYKQVLVQQEKQEHKVEIKEEGKTTHFTYVPAKKKSITDIFQ